MASRSVSVKLEADVGRFTAGITEAKVGTEELDRKVDSLDRSITKIPPDAAKAAAAMKLLGDEGTKAGVKLDDLGQRSTSVPGGRSADRHTRSEIARLADEFNRPATSVFLERMFAGTRELRSWSGSVKQPDQRAGRRRAQGDTADRGPSATPARVPARDSGRRSRRCHRRLRPRSPPRSWLPSRPGRHYIGSVLGGALLAGVAGVGIGAAIAAQISDPLVANALGVLKTDLGRMFKDVTVGVRAGADPLRGRLRRDRARGGAGLKSAFEAAAPFAETFLRGVGDFVRNALPGLETALVAGSKILAGWASRPCRSWAARCRTSSTTSPRAAGRAATRSTS
jgi:hypothetical protein